MDGIEKICNHLPGAAAKICKDEVEKMLPVAVNILTSVVVSCTKDSSSEYYQEFNTNGMACSLLWTCVFREVFSQYILSHIILL